MNIFRPYLPEVADQQVSLLLRVIQIHVWVVVKWPLRLDLYLLHWTSWMNEGVVAHVLGGEGCQQTYHGYRYENSWWGCPYFITMHDRWIGRSCSRHSGKGLHYWPPKPIAFTVDGNTASHAPVLVPSLIRRPSSAGAATMDSSSTSCLFLVELNYLQAGWKYDILPAKYEINLKY